MSPVTKNKNIFELVFIIVVLSALIIPIYFVQPLLDDYSWPYILKSTGSFFKTQILFYNAVNGRVLATFVSSLFMNNHSFFTTYKVGIIIYILIYFYVIYYCISKIITIADIIKKIIISGFVVFFITLNLAQLSTFHYWLTGVIVYMSSFILFLIFFVKGLKLFTSIKNGCTIKNAEIIIYMLCGFASILFFEMSFLLIFPIHIFIMIQMFINKRKVLPFILAILFLLIAVSLNIRAPGSSIKSVQYVNIDRIHSLSYSFSQTISGFLSYILSVHFFFFMVYIFFILLFKGKNKLYINPKYKIPAYYFILLIIFNFCSFNLVYSYFLGTSIPGRVGNFVVAVNCIFITLFVLSMERKIVESKTAIQINLLYLISLGFLISTFLFPSNIRLIYGDLIHGRMHNYKLEMDKRYIIVKNANQKICYVNSIKNVPNSIMYYDLEQDSTSMNSFFNKQFASFFGKEMVIRK